MQDSTPEPTPSTPGDVALFVRGEIDLATVPELRRRLGRASTRGPELVVDLSAVTFMDCAGLHPLLEARRRQRALGGRLLLIGPSWAVVRVLQMTGFLAAFTIVDVLARVPGQAATWRRGEPAVGGLPIQRSGAGASRADGGVPVESTTDGATVADDVKRLGAELDGLRAMMRTRPTIDQARGILMALHRCDAERAWAMLVQASQTRNVKVRDLATAMIQAATETQAGRGSGSATGMSTGATSPEMAAALADLMRLTGDQTGRCERDGHS